MASKSALIDLEDMQQDFVIEVKQIKIPQYPHAFNPSIIEWEESFLLSFRVIPDPKQSFNSWIGLIWLNENFEPISAPQQIPLRAFDSNVPLRAEDARLISVQDTLYIVYSDNEDTSISKGGFRVYIAELGFENRRCYIKKTSIIHHIERLSTFPGNDINRREKNWTPFVYDNTLLLAYSLTPHIIFQPLFGTNSASFFTASDEEVPWLWGELRGGTQALLNGDHYLGFFHSVQKMASVHSHGKQTLHYFMGAYIFSAHPPFEITHISPEPIIGKGFYSGIEYKPYWHPVQAIFPCGYVYNKEKHRISIVYGRQDHEMWVVELDEKKLYESLIATSEK